MAFSTIHTNYGLARMTAAEATGVPINLTHMAVGDGNGNPTTPLPTQTALVRETYRATINRIYQSPDRPTQFEAELIVPVSAGGFTLREAAVFDSDGSMFVVGNTPDAYLPGAGEGGFTDAVIRMVFEVSNASVVNLIVDPNVAVASQAWVINNITAASIIPGGLNTQVLTKQSNADGDYVWADPDVANVVVDVIEEKQTLAALQTQVNLAIVNTNGLAVYIEGVRIPKGSGLSEWDTNPSSPIESIILGQSYPAGSIITLVQNDPLGTAIVPLEKSQNLGDLPSVSTARGNLDVYSKAEARQFAPAGLVATFAMSTAPAGWLKCNGATVSRTVYAALFAAIGTTYGAGDGSTTFKLPDLRGEFPRYWDDSKGVDIGRVLGSSQAHMTQIHSHSASSSSSGSHTHTGTTSASGNHTHSASTAPSGSHTHPAVTDTAGSHSHTYESPTKFNDPNYFDEGGFPSVYRTDFSTNYSTSTSGAHSHSVSVTAAGEHAHGVSVSNSGDHTHTLAVDAGGSHSHTISIGAFGGVETRPRNVALLACIKF